MTPADTALLDYWRSAYQAPVDGWDFSDLDVEEPSTPWSYERLARESLPGAGAALDLGTGGGEVLLSLADALPPDTVATEGWPPNLPVAQRALGPHGIDVVAYDAEGPDPGLPFPDGRFDVVLDRHEAYLATEVHRVLRPGGRFLTQQVDGRDFEELQNLFGGHTRYAHITLENLRAELLAAGFEVLASDEWRGRGRFPDVETLVRYVARVPWEVPEDFGVDRYADRLLELHKAGAELTFTQRRFYLLAQRPG